jgi:hypothetical protein
MNPQSFLELLCGDKPKDSYILIWSLQDKCSHWCRSSAEAAQIVETCNNMDIYVGVGLSSENSGPQRRCPAEKIAAITGLWMDFDLLSDAHPKKALPSTLTDALTVIPQQMPPTIIVNTGNGAHAWWVLKEPFIFENDAERDRAKAAIYRWQTMLRFNGANRGWAFDRLADLSRVLRLPGTTNFKDPNSPKPVIVHQLNDRRYNLSDFEEFLEVHGIPGSERIPKLAQELTELDRNIVVNVNAEIPEEQIQRWTEADLRFRNTWFRQRHDLKDQSQSGYDLALADFGVDVELTPQQITDLIVHHRRLHNQKPRTRSDYFGRTIRRATSRADSAPNDPILHREGSTSQSENIAGPEPNDADTPIDALAAKAALCELISNRLGIRILRILKITGKEPTYQIELEHGRIELSSVSKLVDQRSLRLAIASATNKLIPKIKPRQWERLAQTMLDALIEREGGPETELEGAIRGHLGHYLSEVAFIPCIEGQPAHAIRRPMIHRERIAVNSIDLQVYVFKAFGQNLTLKAIASALSAIGAQSIRVRGTRINEQGRWLLPVDEFDPAEFAEQDNPAAEEAYADAK